MPQTHCLHYWDILISFSMLIILDDAAYFHPFKLNLDCSLQIIDYCQMV
jgi:hypothetical protein